MTGSIELTDYSDKPSMRIGIAKLIQPLLVKGDSVAEIDAVHNANEAGLFQEVGRMRQDKRSRGTKRVQGMVVAESLGRMVALDDMSGERQATSKNAGPCLRLRVATHSTLDEAYSHAASRRVHMVRRVSARLHGGGARRWLVRAPGSGPCEQAGCWR